MSTDLFGVRVLDVDRERRRVRIRVFVVYYEPSWGTDDLLPNDASFFFRVLWEGADDARGHDGGPLADLVGLDEFLDEEWVDRHTRLFVAGVERVVTRNHPLDDDAWDRLAMFYYEHDGGWQDEDLLAQGDYDVEVTDPRCLTPLRLGQSWGSTSYVSKAVEAVDVEKEYAALAAGGDTRAAFVLGWFRQKAGDAAGAATAYRLAAGTQDPDERMKALLYLGDLYAEQGDPQAARAAYAESVACRPVPGDGRYVSRVALKLGVLLRASGAEEEARAMFTLAEQSGGIDLVREARRLAGTETWAERTCRALRDTDQDTASRALTDACGSAAVARFGTILAQRQSDRARAALACLTEPADLERAAGFGLDLATVWTRENDDYAVNMVIDVVVATGRPAEGYRLALAEGLIEAGSGRTSCSEKVAFQLLRLLKDNNDLDGLARLVLTAEQAHPRVAANACHFLGLAGKESKDLQTAATWLRRGAALTEPDEDAAAGPAYDLGIVRAEQGDLDGARAAFSQAERGFVYLGDRVRAALSLAGLLDGRGEHVAAGAAWTRAAFHQAWLDLDIVQAQWSIRRLGDLLAGAGEEEAARTAYELAGESREPSTAPGADACAAYHYARWTVARGNRDSARAMLRTIADGAGPYAARAAAVLRKAAR
ncbi:tetratricopeptide repeat protein [Nonomuraea sp. NPDC048882]|uniref:tetratricopeptide repeat protein n=1 Tax=Nonomuraea sp. NPDC048882 TaxID=3154347 RepID=UPI00340D4FCE